MGNHSIKDLFGPLVSEHYGMMKQSLVKFFEVGTCPPCGSLRETNNLRLSRQRKNSCKIAIWNINSLRKCRKLKILKMDIISWQSTSYDLTVGVLERPVHISVFRKW